MSPPPSAPLDVTEKEADRFWSRVNVGQPKDCWEWQGCRTVLGYGRFHIGGRSRATHRVAYSIACGPLVPGLDIDHLCSNRACVNPSHLEQVTHIENVRRGRATGRRKTHCVQGHEYTPENTLIHKTRWRRCKECKRTQNREHMRRKLAAARGAR